MLKLTLASGASTTPAGLPRRGPRPALGSVALFFEAEDVAPGLDCISVARIEGSAHMAQ
jgi:hypothetical protein